MNDKPQAGAEINLGERNLTTFDSWLLIESSPDGKIQVHASAGLTNRQIGEHIALIHGYIRHILNATDGYVTSRVQQMKAAAGEPMSTPDVKLLNN